MRNAITFLALSVILVVPLQSQNSINLQVVNKFLHLPVPYNEEDDARLQLVVEGEVKREFDIFTAFGLRVCIA